MRVEFRDIDSYIATFPIATRKLLMRMRSIIKKAAPDAQEIISYGMPTFKLGRNLVHFTGYKQHIGFYPSSSGIAAFRHRFKGMVFSKGAVQFPLDKPLPIKLISDITRFRVKEEKDRLLKKLNRLFPKLHDSFLSGLSAPARRALESKGIDTLRQLSRFTESEILKLHGVGKTTIPKLRALLKAEGLTFRTLSVGKR